LPDASWVKKNITLYDVARHLGLEMNGRHIRCPRDGSHWANPHLKTNGVKCFKCVHQPHWSNIDLVMEITGCDFSSALRWFEARWPDIPRCKPRLHKGQRKWEGMKPLRRPNMVVPSVEMLHKSRWWPLLDCVARRVAEALVKMVPADTMTLTTTQEAIREAAGTQRKYMRRVWTILEAIGMVEAQRVAALKQPKRGYTTALQVRLTWNSQKFLSGLNMNLSYPRPVSMMADESDNENPQVSDHVPDHVLYNVEQGGQG
jgi:hypothetical protein